MDTRVNLAPHFEDFSFKVRGARVVWADYELLRHYLRFGSKSSNANLDQLIESELALTSMPHTKRNDLHDAICVSKDRVPVFRTKSGKRVVTRVFDGVPIDIKGAGLPEGSVPSNKPYSTGLCQFHKAMTEVYTQRLISKIFKHTDQTQCVPFLACVMLPISVPYNQTKRFDVPCAILLRPHVSRYLHDVYVAGSEPARRAMLVELALRRYGLTSASDAYCVEFSQNGSEVVGIRAGHRLSSDAVEAFLPHLNELSHSKGVAFDVVNVQFAYDCIASQSCMIDFEHFMHRPRFQNKLIQMQFGLRESRLAITREGLMDGINRQMIRHRGARRLGATTMEIRSKGTEIAPSIAVRKIEGQFLDACLLTGEFSRLRSKIERLVRLADR